MLGTVVQIDAWDPAAGSAVTLQAGSHDDVAVCTLNGQTWWPALAKLPSLKYDLFDGAFEGQISAPTSSLSLVAEPWPNLARYQIADARVRVWTGNVGDAWPWTLRFDGRAAGQPKLSDNIAELDIAVDDRWLDAPLLSTYAGTGGAEGGTDLTGQAKPLALGAPLYVSGVLVDSVNSVFQVSAYGAINGFTAALEKLARFGSAAANYASHAALVAATIAPGTWATCTAEGKARFGAPPAGKVSFLLNGDAAGPDGWARKPGQLIRRVALLSGGTGKIDDTSLNALDTARPYNLSLYLDQQTTARELIQSIAASVNAVAGVTWAGKLFVRPVALGTPSLTLAADGSALPPVASVEQATMGAPFKRLAISAQRCWSVHDLSDVAFAATLLPVGNYDGATTYREGNIVTLASGEQWVFINTTPSSGHAPPTSGTSNSYWQKLTSATRNSVTVSSSAPASPIDGDSWVDTSGALAVFKVRSAGAWVTGATALTAYNQLSGKPVALSDINSTESAKLAGIQANADVTADSQIVVSSTASAGITLQAASDGTLNGSSPYSTFSVNVAVGATDKTTDNLASYAISTTSGVTATINNTTGSSTKGQVNITAMSGVQETITVTVTYNGVAQPPVTIPVAKNVAAPTSSGGAGAKTAQPSTFNHITSTSFAALTNVMTLTIAAGESLYATAGFAYTGAIASPEGALVGKWQYAVSGSGTYSDFGAAVTGSGSSLSGGGSYYHYNPGSISCNQTKGGLSAGNYDVRFVGAKNGAGSGGTDIVYMTGSMAVQAKV